MLNEDKAELMDLIRQVVETSMPDLRHYYRMPKKGKVTAVYASDGSYYADVQPLRNDESVDDAEPVVAKVEIPIMWGGPERGVVCPPTVGTLCDITYYDGDPNFPRISNIRWHGQGAPKAELNEYVIQLEPGVEIRIDKEKHIVTLTPENICSEAGKDEERKIGKNWTVVVGQNATIKAGKRVTVQAPDIDLIGNVYSHGEGEEAISETHERTHRTHDGSYTLNGPQAVNGTVSVSKNLTVGGTVTAGKFVGPVQGCNGGCGG